MNRLKKISRRKFVQKGGLLLLIPAVYAWYEMIRTEKMKLNPGQLQFIGNSIPQGFSFHDKAIIHRNNENFRVFEPRCTHLGCIINQEIDGEMVCACHGSRFNLNGRPLNGPAVRQLKELEYNYDPVRDILIINL